MTFQCAICGESHDTLPDIGADKPDHWWSVPEEERDKRIQLTTDTCIIDEKDYFIRGVIQIPVHEQAEPFGFGVWVSQKRENFMTYLESFDSPEIGPFFGWLCTRIAYYPQDTMLLKTRAHFIGANLRPRIELAPADHQLVTDQHDGISLAKAWEFVHFYMNLG